MKNNTKRAVTLALIIIFFGSIVALWIFSKPKTISCHHYFYYSDGTGHYLEIDPDHCIDIYTYDVKTRKDFNRNNTTVYHIWIPDIYEPMEFFKMYWNGEVRRIRDNYIIKGTLYEIDFK